MRELSLFTGAGGGLYGTMLLGWTPICAVEQDPYRRAVLLARQRDGIFPPFEIHDDVRTFDGAPWRGRVDVVTGGFPCQPFSAAGKKLGADDERNLWPETIRVIRAVRPRLAFLENVPGLLAHRYFGTVLGELAEAGLDAEWCVLGASDVGAPHLRKRLWILAYDPEHGRGSRRSWRSDRGRSRQSEQPLWAAQGSLSDAEPRGIREQRQRDGEQHREPQHGEPRDDGPDRPMANADQGRREGSGLEEHGEFEGASGDLADGCRPGRRWHGPSISDSDGEPMGRPTEPRRECRQWAIEPDVGRVAHGVADRRNRLAALGDGQVPAVVRAAWDLLSARIAN